MDGAQCTACNGKVHYHCGGITEIGYSRLGERRSSWRCPKCKQAGNRTPSPSTITSSLPNKQASMASLQPPSSNIDQTIPPGGDSVILKEIARLAEKLKPIEALTYELKSLREEMSSIKQSVLEFNNTIKDLNTRIGGVETRLTKVEQSTEQISDIRRRLDGLENDLANKEQWSRMNNVELKGVTQTRNENLVQLVTMLGSKINYPISKDKINFVTRVPSRDSNQVKPIIVCFNNRYVKEDFIAAARTISKETHMTPTVLGLQGNHRIFVNDHLTTRNKILLSNTKKAAKEKGFRYVWVKHAKIFMRRDDLSPIITIKTERDLSKVV